MKYLAHIIRILFFAAFVLLLLNGKMLLWFAVFAASLILGVVFGRLYCGYVCPMNTLMIPTAWLSKKLKINTDKTPPWLPKGVVPWLMLGLTLVTMLIGKRLLHIDFPILPIWLAIAVLVTLRYKPEVFHNLICPFGALQKALGRFAIFSKRVTPDTCIGCKKCENVCPSAAIAVDPTTKKAIITTALCHQCTECTDVCPTHAIRYMKAK